MKNITLSVSVYLLFRSLKRFIFIAGLLSMLTACDDDLQVGSFTDSPVAGLTYTTENRSGVTDGQGQFLYYPGEMITFSMGDTTLGEAVPAQTKITPIDLVPGIAPVTTMREFSSLKKRAAEKGVARSFNQWVNMTVFLQTLDTDGNPDNGISIHPGVAELLSGVQIDFTGDFWGFDQSQAFRRLRHQAFNAGYVKTAVGPSPAAALDHFYAAQNIDARFFRQTEQRTDYGADGSVDSVNMWAYDAQGNLLSSCRVFNGIPDDCTQWKYSADDQVISETQYDQDGQPGNTATHEYDGYGNRVKTLNDFDVGTVDLSPNSNNVSLSAGVSLSDSVGFGCCFTWILPADIIWHYDADGNLLKKAQYSLEGELRSIAHRTHDAAGRLIQESSDNNGDTIIDATDVYDYDADGRLMTHARYSDDGQTKTASTLYEYHPQGALLKITHYDIQYQSTFTETYDLNGNRVRAVRDWDADGQPDTMHTAVFDVDGRRIQTTEESPYRVYRHTYEYDADGNLVVKSSYRNGVPTALWTYSYDANNNRTSRVSDYFDDDGSSYHTVTIAWTYDYDSTDNVVAESVDYGGDGVWYKRVEFSYEASGWAPLLKALMPSEYTSWPTPTQVTTLAFFY